MSRKASPPSATKRRSRTKSSARRHQHSIAATIAELERLEPATPNAAKLIGLLTCWLNDESGYDEEAWPALKNALDQERRRLRARKLFDR